MASPINNREVESVTCPHCLRGFGGIWWVTTLHFEGPQPEGDEPWACRAITCPLCERPIVELGRLEGLPASRNHSFSSASRVWPAGSSRPPLPPVVPATFSEEYYEAVAVLDKSPKASAALSRRCLQHLLRDHVKVKPGELSKEIDQLLDSHTLPSDLAEDVDAIRHVGNFGAHPNKSAHSGQILDVEPHEAEWSLAVLEGLFDFYFVRTAQRAAQRTALEAKLQAAGKTLGMKKP